MDLAHYIEHTILNPDCNSQAIEKLCAEAIHYQFCGVCVPPFFLSHAASVLNGNQSVRLVTVIGFPMGYSATAAKVEETVRAIDDGADELDVVINGCAVQDGNWSFVKQDLNQITEVVHQSGKVIKIIIEAGLLSEKELLRCCDLCSEVGVDFVKTSTGFFGGGASASMVGVMRGRLPAHIKIKASGGIRDMETAKALVKAGAERLGTSAGPSLVTLDNTQ